MNADGTETVCPVALMESAPLIALIAAVVFVSAAGTAFVKSSLSALRATTTNGEVVTTGAAMVAGGALGFVDIVSDWSYLVLLGTQRRLATLFWISLGSLLSSMIINTAASILFLQHATAESADAKAWLQDAKNRNWAAVVVLFSTSRVETLEMLAWSGHGFPMRRRWLETVAALGILTPLVEDAAQLYVVITASTMLEEWTPFALVNLGSSIAGILTC